MATLNNIDKHLKAANLPDEQLKANIKMLNYIKLLANTTNCNMAKWDLTKMFCVEGSDTIFISDKKLVNKIFFEKLAKLAEKKVEESETINIPHELVEALENGYKATVAERKRALEEKIRYSLRDYEDWSRRFDDYVASIMKIRKELDATSGENPTESLKKEISDCLSEGLWINPIVKDGYLYLNTATNIICTHKIPSANVDISVDFGQLAVKINLSNFIFKVIPYKKNISHSRYSGSRYFHPHVDPSGNICWGNARDAALDHIRNYRIGATLKLLYAILTTYNDGNPYVRIADFKEASKSYGRVNEDMKHPDKTKEKKEDEVVTSNSNLTTVSAPTVPVFNVGDQVECEQGPDGNPRYNYNTDQGSSGRWMQGTVSRVIEECRTVMVRFESGVEWEWPLLGHEDFREDQWSRPGYLRHNRPF